MSMGEEPIAGDVKKNGLNRTLDNVQGLTQRL